MELRGECANLRKVLGQPKRFASSHYPRVVFLPSDNRDLVIPRVRYKAPGQLDDTSGYVAWWQRPSDQQWGGSTLELLFSARWADLNAKEEGRSGEALNFQRYTHAFSDLTAGQKTLGWTRKGDLVVNVDGGDQHDVDQLSSGERQALLLLSELRRLWRPLHPRQPPDQRSHRRAGRRRQRRPVELPGRV